MIREPSRPPTRDADPWANAVQLAPHEHVATPMMPPVKSPKRTTTTTTTRRSDITGYSSNGDSKRSSSRSAALRATVTSPVAAYRNGHVSANGVPTRRSPSQPRASNGDHHNDENGNDEYDENHNNDHESDANNQSPHSNGGHSNGNGNGVIHTNAMVNGNGAAHNPLDDLSDNSDDDDDNDDARSGYASTLSSWTIAQANRRPEPFGDWLGPMDAKIKRRLARMSEGRELQRTLEAERAAELRKKYEAIEAEKKRLAEEKAEQQRRAAEIVAQVGTLSHSLIHLLYLLYFV
jgi:hypothetical protein